MVRANLVGAVLVAMVPLLGCGGSKPEGASSNAQATSAIDLRSYRLGGIGAFAEMVGAGVKQLALSSPMTTAEVDGLLDEALRIAGENRAQIYRETDFLVTDLFAGELTDGLEVLLIFKDDTLDRYMALKADKTTLIEDGGYEGPERLEVARRFGRLLSYPETRIEELLASGT